LTSAFFTSGGSTNNEYGYNTLGQLVTVTAQYQGGTYVDAVTTYGYDKAGNLTSEILPNGVTNTYTYDSQNRLTLLVETNNTGTILFSQANTLNDDGTIESALEYQLQTSGSVITNTYSYLYDALDRLTGETLSSSQSNLSYTNSFTYDLNSNQMSETHVTGATTQVTTNTYNANDELTTSTVAVSGTTNSFTTNSYDANGSLIQSMTDASGTWTTNSYSYDVRNKMVGFAVNGTTLATYVYDDDGDRVSETAGGATTSWLTNTNNPTGYDQQMEEKIGGSLAESYVIGYGVLGQSNSGGTLSWLLVDGHGSTQQLTNASGTVTAALIYDSFGNLLSGSAALTPFMFGGDAVFDPVSGTYFNGDGDGGRQRPAGSADFLEADVWGYSDNSNPITLNNRIYGDGDPANESDPSGHFGYSSYSSYSQNSEWSLDALAPIALGVSVLEGVEDGYANAAMDTSSYGGALLAGFAGGLATSMLGFDGEWTWEANSAGNAITSLYNQFKSHFLGGYGFVGGAFAERNPGDGGAGAELGIGVTIGNDGIGVGLEGYVYGSQTSNPNTPYGGMGFWAGIQRPNLRGNLLKGWKPGFGAGGLAGYDFGPFQIESFVDPISGMTSLGFSLGPEEGFGIGVGIGAYFSGPLPPVQ